MRYTSACCRGTSAGVSDGVFNTFNFHAARTARHRDRLCLSLDGAVPQLTLARCRCIRRNRARTRLRRCLPLHSVRGSRLQNFLYVLMESSWFGEFVGTCVRAAGHCCARRCMRLYDRVDGPAAEPERC